MYLEGNHRLYWASIYGNLLRTSEPRTILQELWQITARKNGEKIAMAVSRYLLQMFANKIQLQYGKIEAAIFSEEYFQNSSHHPDFISLKVETELCIQFGDCDSLLDKLESIGMISRDTSMIRPFKFCQTPLQLANPTQLQLV